jgi:hypothetical protein
VCLVQIPVPLISCSVPVGNFLVPEGTVPRLQSVLLFCEGDVGAGEEGWLPEVCAVECPSKP